MIRTEAPPQALAQRLVSLDVFRGVTMAAMVVVNDPGDWSNAYWPLLHAEWNGWTPTDLIFPFFLFMVGVSMTLSRSTVGSGWKVLRRGALLIVIGWLLSLFPYFRFATWRFPGVLVRIGVCYLATAGILRFLAPGPEAGDRRRGYVLLAWAIGLTVAYWLAMAVMPFPGHDAGDLTPGGNLGGFIDRTLLGQNHMYGRRPWDPEGLFSTIPAIASTLMGVLAGLWLRADGTRETKALLMALGGIAAMAVGYAWDLWFPINKNLWTSSYVWFTGGAAATCLAGCYWAIDVKGWRWWTKPFVILGVNAIALYALSALGVKILSLIKVAGPQGKTLSAWTAIYRSGFQPFFADPRSASLMFALAYLVFLYVILWVMYRRRIFLKL
jgi:predicted acyltransferase